MHTSNPQIKIKYLHSSLRAFGVHSDTNMGTEKKGWTEKACTSCSQ